MVRKATRATALKASETTRRESPRRTRRRKSSSNSENSDEEASNSTKYETTNQSEKGSSGNESDTDSRKPLKKRTRSKAANNVNIEKSDLKDKNEEQPVYKEEVNEDNIEKGKSNSINMSNNDENVIGTENETMQVTDESPNDVNNDTIPSEELSKNGMENSTIDVNISQNILEEMTCESSGQIIETETTEGSSQDIQQEQSKSQEQSFRRDSKDSKSIERENVSEDVSKQNSSRKIKLNRLPKEKILSSDDHSKKVDKKDTEGKKKIALKRPKIKPSSIEEVKQPENSPTKEQTTEETWGSSYEANNDEKPDQSAYGTSTKKKITLKRTTIDDSNGSSSLGRSISVPEKSERRKSSLDNITINERRRRSTGHERSTSESEEKPRKPKKPTKVVKLVRKLPDQSQEPPPPGEEPPKKYKWGHPQFLDLSVSILELDSLKEVCPSIELLKEEDLDLNLTPFENKSPDRIKRKTFKELEDEEMENIEAELNAEPEEIEIKENIIAMNRKISIVDDTASKLKPPPSPAKNPTSEVLFISNLVRPFTAKQLKELLERTGKIREDGFWTDRIKSKCYVYYETTEEAEATRNALHGVHWPIGNGKKLIIDFATVEDMENAKNPPIPAAKVEKSIEKENKKPELFEEKDHKHASKRDWDVGKKEEDRRKRSVSRERRERKHSRRSHTPEGSYSKRRKHEEPVPQKAMDDLFLKTKATPSIYWQPLSPEEIARKQQQRQLRLEQNKRRLEEIRSSARSAIRDRGGRDRNFRRR